MSVSVSNTELELATLTKFGNTNVLVTKHAVQLVMELTRVGFEQHTSKSGRNVTEKQKKSRRNKESDSHYQVNVHNISPPTPQAHCFLGTTSMSTG